MSACARDERGRSAVELSAPFALDAARGAAPNCRGVSSGSVRRGWCGPLRRSGVVVHFSGHGAPDAAGKHRSDQAPHRKLKSPKTPAAIRNSSGLMEVKLNCAPESFLTIRTQFISNRIRTVAFFSVIQTRFLLRKKTGSNIET